MKIISINAGSSSLKYSLFNMDDESVISSGVFERIGIDGSKYTIKYNGEKIEQEIEINTHTDAVKMLLEKLVDLGIIKSLDEISGVGHRIVHGGSKYSESVLVTDEVIEDIGNLKEFAPLHNPAHLLGINAFREVLPDVPMTVVFDTAFHQTMDEVSYLYPVPYKWYEDYQVRKYGAHGTSHRYIADTYKELAGKDQYKIISCHIGNGGSITAIKDGKCVDTSMGFTPLAGIMMGTRSGDIDPSIVPYVMEKEGKSASEIMNDLNKKSGFLGISGISSDSRDIEDGINEGNERCELTLQMYVNSIVKYIASYYLLLGHTDALVLTAGIGENSPATREAIVEALAPLGIKIDKQKNDMRGKFAKVSTDDSTVDVYVLPTNEELMIAKDTMNLINR